jgi:cathepsin B
MRIFTDKDQIMQEVMNHGPIMAGLTIYEDLFNYEGGVYHHVSGEVIGGHAVKLLGWGHDDKAGLYWICQNQWTDEWGEEGFFKIKHGEVGIDSMAMACDPDLI